jgi:pimeloyl-ACP methyl ester carboxylesterase
MTSRALALLALLLASACATNRQGARPAGGAAERIFTVDGSAGRLRVSDAGTGEPALVFVHGLGSELEVWRPTLERLRSSRRVVAYDQRGHGGSDRTGGYTLDALASDLEALRRALGLERMVLVGHSMAGAVITTYAGTHPERVAGLVYVDAIGDFAGVPREALQPLVEKEAGYGTAEVRAAFVEMLGPKARPATREAVLTSAARLDPRAFGALRRELFDFRDATRRLAAFPGPALAVEAAAPPYPTVLASNVLGIPRTELAGVSHWLQLDDPDALARALDGFLEKLPAAPALSQARR